MNIWLYLLRKPSAWKEKNEEKKSQTPSIIPQQAACWREISASIRPWTLYTILFDHAGNQEKPECVRVRCWMVVLAKTCYFSFERKKYKIN